MSFIEAARLTQDENVVKEPVQHVKEARDYICDLQEIFGVAIVDYLYSFEFKERLEDPEKLPCFTRSLYIHNA